MKNKTAHEIVLECWSLINLYKSNGSKYGFRAKDREKLIDDMAQMIEAFARSKREEKKKIKKIENKENKEEKKEENK